MMMMMMMMMMMIGTVINDNPALLVPVYGGHRLRGTGT